MKNFYGGLQFCSTLSLLSLLVPSIVAYAMCFYRDASQYRILTNTFSWVGPGLFLIPKSSSSVATWQV
jgi:hypothetical protein